MKQDYTIEERIALLEGKNVWQTKELKNGLSLMMADGPHGLRKQNNLTDNINEQGSKIAISYPTASLVACSFDPRVSEKLATLIAREAKAEGVNIILGPGINIKRTPLCGRNFEYFSEDPLLAAKLGRAYIKGAQSQGIGVSLKHFACNNQETKRFHVDSIVDKRTIHEIYLKAFGECIKENPASLMASYNKINRHYATEHPYLDKVLRQKWGYDGLVISDWGAISNRPLSLKYGCDLEMPSTSGYYSEKLASEVKLSLDIRDAVIKSSNRLIKTINKYQIKDEGLTINLDEHHEEAYNIAKEAIVLLKNDDVLPLNKEEKVLFIGNFVNEFRYQGEGSSKVNPYKVEQIKDLLDDCLADVSLGYTFDGDAYNEDLHNEALVKAHQYTKIVMFVGTTPKDEAEGLDRKDLSLPAAQIKLLNELLLINKNVIVVAIAGSVIDLSLAAKAQGLIMAYLSGEAGARAIVDILYGQVNPSGRLAETFISDIKESNIKLKKTDRVFYDEALFVGYRYYNSFNKKVLYPFGYGLSYTNFTYRDFKLSKSMLMDKVKVSCKVKNIGSMAGAEVIQLYIENNKSSVYKAKRELRAFDKIYLEVGEEKEVIFILTKDDFNYFDINLDRFITNTGEYKVQLCSDVNTVIVEEFIVIIDEEEGFIEHPKLSYHKQQYDVSDFKIIYKQNLPKQRIRKRPFSMDSSLRMMRYSLLGLIISFVILRIVKKNIDDENIYKSILDTPIRIIATMSGGRLTLIMAEGIIDVLNYHFIRGMKKIVKGKKKDE